MEPVNDNGSIRPLLAPTRLEQGFNLERSATDSAMSLDDFAQWFEKYGTGGWKKAVQNATFMLGCDVIAQDQAKATLRLMKRTGPKTSRVVEPREHPIAALLAREPNQVHSWYEFTEMMVLWQCFTQNSFAGVIRNSYGDPLELIPFQTTRVLPQVSGRKFFYDVTAATWEEEALLGQSRRVFSADDFIHARGRLIDGFNGYSTMDAGRTTFDILDSIQTFRKSLFDEEGQFRGVFTRDNTEPLPDPIFNRVRAQYGEMMNRFRRMTHPMVLEGGLKFESISSNPKDIELVAEFEAQILEALRTLRVPPHKAFIMNGVKYENLEPIELQYVNDTLVPQAERREAKLNKALLTERERVEFYLEHDREEMTVRDPKALTDRVIRATLAGIYEIDEARAKFGENPLANGKGQARLIPTNTAMVDRDNKVVLGGASTPKAGSEAGADEVPADTKPEDEKAVRLTLVKS